MEESSSKPELDRVDRGALVVVGVVLDRSTPQSFAEFEKAATKLPFLLDCHLVARQLFEGPLYGLSRVPFVKPG